MAFGGCGPVAGGLGAGLGPGLALGTSACCCSGAAFLAPGLSNADISGPSLGSGARSLAPRGLRPVGIGPCPGRTGPSAVAPGSVTMALGGGGAFAASPLHGAAIAGGARPIGTMSPIAAAHASDTDTIRGIGDMSHLPWLDVAIDVRSSLM